MSGLSPLVRLALQPQQRTCRQGRSSVPAQCVSCNRSDLAWARRRGPPVCGMGWARLWTSESARADASSVHLDLDYLQRALTGGARVGDRNLKAERAAEATTSSSE